MTIKQSKGFTIIELLVVIAIIAVLASVVLVNLTQYISKGKDAAARANLSTLLTNAAVYYDTNSSYNTFNGAASTTYQNVLTALQNAGYTITSTCDSGAGCPATATKFCASVPLKATSNIFCVDTAGNKKEGAASTCAAGVCP